MIEQIIEDWLVDTEKQLFDNYIKLGLKASGKWGESLEHTQENTGTNYKATIKANKYAYQLEHGRLATAPDKRGRLYGIMQRWIADKGITPRDPKMSIKTLAWIFARKIDLEGITVPNQFNAGGLISNIITEKQINKLTENIATIISTNAKSSIIKTFKK